MSLKSVSGWLPSSMVFGASLYSLVEGNVIEAA